MDISVITVTMVVAVPPKSLATFDTRKKRLPNIIAQ